MDGHVTLPNYCPIPHNDNYEYQFSEDPTVRRQEIATVLACRNVIEGALSQQVIMGVEERANDRPLGDLTPNEVMDSLRAEYESLSTDDFHEIRDPLSVPYDHTSGQSVADYIKGHIAVCV